MTFPPRKGPPAGFGDDSEDGMDSAPFAAKRPNPFAKGGKGKVPAKGKKKLAFKKKAKKPPMPPRRPMMPIADDNAGSDY